MVLRNRALQRPFLKVQGHTGLVQCVLFILEVLLRVHLCFARAFLNLHFILSHRQCTISVLHYSWVYKGIHGQGRHGGLVVSRLNSQSRGRGQIPTMAEILFDISAPPAPPRQLSSDEYTDRTLSVGRWEMVRKRTSHPPPSYAEAKKIMWLALHTKRNTVINVKKWNVQPDISINRAIRWGF